MAIFSRSDDGKKDGKRTRALPLLPLRDIIVFPHMVVPLFVGRQKSIAALEEAMGSDKAVLLCAQKKAKTNEPTPEDIFAVGTVGSIIQLLRLPDGTVKVLVEGKHRARVKRFLENEKFLAVEADEIEEQSERTVELEALMRSVHSTFEAYVKLNKRIPPEMLTSVASIDDPARLADTIVAHLSLKLNDKQSILETESPAKRLEKLYELMQGEIEILQVEKKIRTRVKKQMEKTQKEYYLNEQMQAIQKELGERDEFKNEIQELEEKIKNKKMSKEATLKVKKELKKLKMMSPMSAEATVVRNYIDWILSLPWYEYTDDKLEIPEAERILDEDHYGLKKPKERILEYLAVQKLVDKIKGPILCFVGPPGVGKTSLGKSIARAMDRRFVRISLGGVRDEAEVRGHRRTYIGALPGKIIQSLKKAGSGNPVFLLDEVDKMSTDFRGDPSAALLEVLDPEQNFCLQRPLPGPRLRPLQGHVHLHRQHHGRDPAAAAGPHGDHPAGRVHRPREALHRHPLPDPQAAGAERARRRPGRPAKRSALKALIHNYTKESGVRSLEREIARHLPQDRQGRPQDRPARGQDLPGHREAGAEVPGAAALPLRHRRGAGPGRPRHRPGLDRAGGRAAHRRGHGHAGQGQAHHHRQAGRGHAGVGAGGHELRPLPRRAARPGQAIPRERATSTCTCPRAPSPRTGPRPASPWPPRWSRRCAACRCAGTWP